MKRITHFFLTVIVLVYILFEEIVWERLAEPIVTTIRSLKILQRLALTLRRIDSRIILVIFVAIFGVVELLGIYAGILFVQGSVITAILLYALKIPIAAFTFWLFEQSKDRLLKFKWFAKVYHAIIHLIDRIKASEIYREIKAKSQRIKSYLKTHLSQRRSAWIAKIKHLYHKFKRKY